VYASGTGKAAVLGLPAEESFLFRRVFAFRRAYRF